MSFLDITSVVRVASLFKEIHIMVIRKTLVLAAILASTGFVAIQTSGAQAEQFYTSSASRSGPPADAKVDDSIVVVRHKHLASDTILNAADSTADVPLYTSSASRSGPPADAK